MNKEKYERTELEIIEFDTEDVITDSQTSGSSCKCESDCPELPFVPI